MPHQDLLQERRVHEFVQAVLTAYRTYPYVMQCETRRVPLAHMPTDVHDVRLRVMNSDEAIRLIAEEMSAQSVIELAKLLVDLTPEAQRQLGEYFEGELNPDSRYPTEAPKRTARLMELLPSIHCTASWDGGTLLELSRWLVEYLTSPLIAVELRQNLGVEGDLNGYGLFVRRDRLLREARARAKPEPATA